MRASSVPSGLMAQTVALSVSSPFAGLSRKPRSLWVNSTPGELVIVVKPEAWRSCQGTLPDVPLVRDAHRPGPAAMEEPGMTMPRPAASTLMPRIFAPARMSWIS